jgi:hypothetical protein
MTQLAGFFTEMEKYIADSRKTLAEGKDLSLDGMDKRIAELCDKVWELMPEQRTLYEDRLRTLLENLNALGLEMKAQMEGIKDIPQHRRANVAYKTADSRDNFGRRDEDKK